MKKKLSSKWLMLVLSLVLCCAGFVGCGNKTEDPVAKEQESNDGKQAEDATLEEEQTEADAEAVKESRKAELRKQFLAEADAVIVNEDSVTFTDAVSAEGETITVAKNLGSVVNLYSSFTTLWYEAGGDVIGCIGGSSATELYEEYIGRDITQDEGVTAVATSAAGKKWDVETIINLQPELIICSKAMSGYDTISAPAAAADIPVIVVEYEDFADYLKWFKVFCNLNNKPELWDTVAMNALDQVVEVLAEVQSKEGPTVFAMFATTNKIQANTGYTVVGGMINAMNAVNIVDSWENSASAERLDINLETVFAANPEIIIVQAHAENAAELVEEAYGDNPVWQALSAVQNDQIYYLEKELFHNKPNSRFAEAYKKLAEIICWEE